MFRAESLSAPCGWVTSNYPAMRHDLCLGLPQVFLHIPRFDRPADSQVEAVQLNICCVRAFVIVNTLSAFISLPPV